MLKAWFAGLFVAAQLTAPADITQAHQELLRRSDVGSLTPESFVARLVLTRGSDGVPHTIEVWRSGETRTLVRFLDQAERGRFLLRRGRELWLLTPGAKNPVKLPSSYRLYGGVTLDEILGIRLARDFRIVAVDEGPAPDATVTFELRAIAPTPLFPEVRYAVDPRTGRPISAAYRVASGKVATTATFVTWSTTPVLHPSRVTIRDEIRKGAATDVAITTLRATAIPDAVFELSGGAARAQLDALAAAGGPAPVVFLRERLGPEAAEAEPLVRPLPDRPLDVRRQAPQRLGDVGVAAGRARDQDRRTHHSTQREVVVEEAEHR